MIFQILAKSRTVIFLATIFYITHTFYNEHVLLSEWEITLFFFLNTTFLSKTKPKLNSIYQKKKEKKENVTSCLRVSLGNTSITDRRVSSHALLTPDQHRKNSPN